MGTVELKQLGSEGAATFEELATIPNFTACLLISKGDGPHAADFLIHVLQPMHNSEVFRFLMQVCNTPAGQVEEPSAENTPLAPLTPE